MLILQPGSVAEKEVVLWGISVLLHLGPGREVVQAVQTRLMVLQFGPTAVREVIQAFCRQVFLCCSLDLLLLRETIQALCRCLFVLQLGPVTTERSGAEDGWH